MNAIHTKTPEAPATGQKYPLYRLVNGEINCQHHKGGDWYPVDFVWANILLSKLDGTELPDCELAKRNLIPDCPKPLFWHPV